MTDQTKPMDAERLAEIRRKIDQWARGTYDATEEEFEEVIFTDIPDLLAEVERLNAERDALDWFVRFRKARTRKGFNREATDER